MIPRIRFLFVGPPSRVSIENQKLLASNSLPIEGHFEASTSEALDYLHNCSGSRFPEVIMLDEQMEEEAISKMLQTYRQEFYNRQMDTLIFVSGKSISLMEEGLNNSLISGYIQLPLDRTVFLEQICPLISLTLV